MATRTCNNGTWSAWSACGGEANTSSDAKNCGTCGHSCLGGTCSGGICQPTTLVSGFGQLRSLAIAGEYVYFTDYVLGPTTSSIYRVRRDGVEGSKTIASAQVWLRGLAASATKVVWGTTDELRECEAPDCNGGSKKITGGLPTNTDGGSLISASSIDDSGGRVFLAIGRVYKSSEGEIRVVSFSGTSRTIASSPQTADPSAVVFRDGIVYWTDNASGIGGVKRMSADGSNVVTLVPGLMSITIALTASTVGFQNDGKVLAAPLPDGIANGQPIMIGDGGGDLAADQNFFYISDYSSDVTGTVYHGTIVRCPSSGCPGSPVVLATGTWNPISIVVDDVAVYWLTDQGTVLKVAK